MITSLNKEDLYRITRIYTTYKTIGIVSPESNKTKVISDDKSEFAKKVKKIMDTYKIYSMNGVWDGISEVAYLILNISREDLELVSEYFKQDAYIFAELKTPLVKNLKPQKTNYKFDLYETDFFKNAQNGTDVVYVTDEVVRAIVYTSSASSDEIYWSDAKDTSIHNVAIQTDLNFNSGHTSFPSFPNLRFKIDLFNDASKETEDSYEVVWEYIKDKYLFGRKVTEEVEKVSDKLKKIKNVNIKK